ncbi:hypothetical protein H257_00886 [Aphanomyces astaci]|uniref:Uncharacterized protein n=1 Tax=Aphanomyces astaci TaxID=112090 RepID=W4HEW7_APHAT|nr:hypothetical protein H257_00886 [Aphanomyces astaci]ETV89703.1 hypothetical protein H257_00886 [Aphanomyces astaci]|eukprot:XP_009822103.1 hypothetical protein H257_00886 [Aphanomyces astaci]
MVDAVLARLAQNSMYIRDDLTDNKHQLDADSVIDPTDRSFGIESSNLLQEYYPKTPLMDTPHKPTHGFFVLPGDVGETRQTTAPRSVQPPRARAKSAHPNNRHQVHDIAVHLLVPFETTLDVSINSSNNAPPFSPTPPAPRRAGELAPPEGKPKKPPVLEPAMIPTPRPPLKKQPRPSTGGPTRRITKLPDDVFWSSSKRINTLDNRRPRAAPRPSLKPPNTKKCTRQTLFVDLVQQVRTDMVVEIGENHTSMRTQADLAPPSRHMAPPPRTTLEAPPAVVPQILPKNPMLRPASADATRLNQTRSTKMLTKRRRELHECILSHRSTAPKPHDLPVKNLLLKMYCVLDEYRGHEGQFVKRLKQKPEIPMQKKPTHKPSRRNTEAAAVTPRIYSSNQECSK